MDSGDDPVAAFYDRHPYPPPVDDLGAPAARLGDDHGRRVEHHLIWPARGVDAAGSILVAGCGTAQAVRHARRHPHRHVVGVDVSQAAVAHSRRLAARHRLTNLDVHQLPIERVGELGMRFDHIVCTGVLHHLADPALGLACLGAVLEPDGAMTLMVYARYGRVGVYMVQEYCRRLGLSSSPADIADLVATLSEMPDGHPIGRLLRETRDFLDDDALADALLNPRDRAYSVPEVFELCDAAGLRFGRWVHQAPYLPDCGSIAETPHRARIARLPAVEQYAAVELFRGTITRHSLIAFRADDWTGGVVDFADAAAPSWTPLVVPTAVVVEQRLPPGAAAALLNRAHSSKDLVMFVDAAQLGTFRRIDGRRTIGELGGGATTLVEQLWRHDLVVIDATPGIGR